MVADEGKSAERKRAVAAEATNFTTSIQTSQRKDASSPVSTADRMMAPAPLPPSAKKSDVQCLGFVHCHLVLLMSF